MVTFLLLWRMLVTAVAEDVYPVYAYKENTGLHFCWVKNCEGRAYFNEGGSEGVLLLAWIVDADKNYVSASNAGWSLVSGSTYYGYFPYDGRHYGLSNKKLPVTYEGQKQNGNGVTTHLGAYDFMTAKDNITTTSAQFNFSHLGCVMRLRYTVSRAMSVSSIVLKTEGESLVTSATVNVPEQTVTPTQKSGELTLEIGDMELEKGQTMTAYLMMCPVNLGQETLTVRINAADGTFVERKLTGVALQAGKLYDVNLDDNTVKAKSGAIENTVEGKRSVTENVDASVSTQMCYAPDFIIATLGESELRKKERLLGDVNADGKVDLTDARLLSNYNVGVRPVEIDLSVADTNEDGEITMADANKIVNISLSE